MAKWQDNSTIVSEDDGSAVILIAVFAIIAVVGVLGSFVFVKFRQKLLANANRVKKVRVVEKAAPAAPKPTNPLAAMQAKAQAKLDKKAQREAARQARLDKKKAKEVIEEEEVPVTPPPQDISRDVFVIPNDIYDSKPTDKKNDE